MKPRQGVFHLASILLLPLLMASIFFVPYLIVKIIVGILLVSLIVWLYKNAVD